jgi:hypothetical protein
MYTDRDYGHPTPLPLDEPRTADCFRAFNATPIGEKVTLPPTRRQIRETQAVETRERAA